MLTAPAWDANFADSPVHGAAMQARLCDIVASRCRQRRVAVDVGGHIGTWTIPLAKRFSRVVVFEPMAENVNALMENVTANNVDVFPVALGAARSCCAMRMPDKGNSGCWYAEDGEGTSVLALDAFALSDVDLIKIDVEGMEGAVLRGAEGTLALCKPVVFFEDNGLGPQRYGDQWVNPRDVLEPLGYRRAERLRKNELWVSA